MDALIGTAYQDPFDVVVGELKLNLLSHTVHYKGAVVLLTPIEYRIVEYLALRNGTAISGRQLAYDLTKPGDRSIKNAIGMYISRLRGKFGNDSCYLPVLNPNQKQGYVLYKEKAHV